MTFLEYVFVKKKKNTGRIYIQMY